MAASHLALLATTLLTLISNARGLSWPLCRTYGAEWVSASPHLDGSFPYTSELFFCQGSLNIEGFAIDACVRNGTNCGQEAANLVCQYLGYEANSPGLFTTVPSPGPALSMTGEWCVTAGSYQQLGYLNRTQFDALNSTLQGPTCASLDSVTCYRTRSTLQSIWGSLPAQAAAAPGPATQSLGASPASTTLLPASASGSAPNSGATGDQTFAGRRRLLDSAT